MEKDIKDKIRDICTFHGKDGTSGWLLDEDRFAKIFALINSQKQEILKEFNLWYKNESETIEDAIERILNN